MANACIRVFSVMLLILLFTNIALAIPSGAPSNSLDAPVRTIQSACEINYPPFCMVNLSGQAEGFAVDLFKAAAEVMSCKVTFRTGTWTEVRQMLENRDIEALPLVGRTPEREFLFDFSFPYLSLHGAIVVREGTEDITCFEDLAGKTVGVMAGDNAEEYLRRKDGGYKIVTVNTFEQALLNLSRGSCDAVVIQRLLALRLIQQTGISNLRIVDGPLLDFRQDFCFAVQEGDRKTLALLNEGLSIIMANGTFQKLYTKWFGAFELTSGQPLIIGGDFDYPPFEYIDELGHPAGYNVALTKAIAAEMGLNVHIKLDKWGDIRQGLQNGEIDAIQGMFYSPQRDIEFDFSQPHTMIHHVGVVRKGECSPPEQLEDLAAMRLVVMAGDIMHDFSVEHHLDENLLTVATQEQALEEVLHGHADCALVARLPALYWIKKNEWQDLEVGHKSLLTSQYCYAVPKGEHALLSELSEGLQVLDDNGEYHHIYQHWLSVYDEPSSSFSTILKYSAILILPLLIALFGSLIWSRQLKREVAARTADLQRNQAILKAAMDNSLAGIAIAEAPDAKLSFVNEAGWRIYGKDYKSVDDCKEDEKLATQWLIYHLDGSPFGKDEGPLAQAVLYGKSSSAEHIFKLDSGEERFIWANASPLYNAQQQVVAGIAVYLDITDRVQSDMALRESEERFRSLTEQSTDLIAVTDMNGVIVYVSPASQSIFSIAPEAMMGRHFTDFLDESHINKALDAFRETMGSGGKLVGFELLMKRYDGTVFTGELNGSLFSAGAMYGTLVVIRDISDRKKAEEALRESEQRFRALADHIPGIIYLCKNDSRYTMLYLNDAIETMVGYNKNLFLDDQLSFTDLYHPDDLDNIYRDVDEAVAKKEPFHLTYRMQHSDGRWLWWEEFGAGIFENDKLLFLEGFITDITDRKQVEEERSKLQTQLLQSQKLESVGRLAGGVAHDFNNMLQTILGNCELASMNSNLSSELEGLLSEIKGAAYQSANLTRQLLAFARQQTIAPKVLDLNDTVSGMLKMLRRLIGEDINLAWMPGADLWKTKMDPTQINQILANLSVNARDALDGVGKITIETRNVLLDEEFCSGLTDVEPGDYVRLAVSDTGTGIKSEYLSDIFEPFFTTKKQGEGTGLGLATIYGIVKQNNGHITVDSILGEGTTFTIYFRRFQTDSDEGPDAQLQEPIVGGTETILLVEDDAAILRIGKRMLNGLGYTVLAAHSPNEAIHLVQDYTQEIHLIISDVVMPQMNGSELMNKLLEIRPGLKSLFMSGYTADIIAKRGVLDEGINFMKKPFTVKLLSEKVREAIEESA